MTSAIDPAALDQVFRTARSYTTWADTPVSDALLAEIWADTALAPTSANCSPARIVFVRSAEAKATLKACLAPGNVDKTMSAPVTAIIGQDMEFYEKLPQLFPHTDARSWFAGNPVAIADTAFRNASLQGAYLMLAARAHGLDCGPMSGFDAEKVDAAFFAGTPIKSNFLCNLGYGTDDGLHPRSPRMPFAEACSIV